MKALFIIMDGLGNIPGKDSPLYKARKPNMNRLARQGMLGVLHVLGRGLIPGSDTAHLTLFGYDINKEYPGRGPLEALGAGLTLRKGDVAFRTNFATVKNGKVVDRRAGRIPTEEAKKLEKLIGDITIKGVKFIFRSTTEHRGTLIMRGKGLSSNISDTDPHKTGVPPKEPTGSKKMVSLIKAYSREVAKRLKGKRANYLLLRGAGLYKPIQSFEERFNLKAAAVAGGALYKGVAKYIGMDVLNVKGATGDKHSDYSAKARAAVETAKSHDFIFLHVKATDSCGHDGDALCKRRIIERVDREVIPVVKNHFDVITITGDHATPPKLKGHSGHGVPFLAWGETVGKDEIYAFHELAAQKGGLGHFYGRELMPMILNWMGKEKKIGE